jgi:hypothetical protein
MPLKSIPLTMHNHSVKMFHGKHSPAGCAMLQDVPVTLRNGRY